MGSRRLLPALIWLTLSALVPLGGANGAVACGQPDALTVDAAFDLAANGLLPPSDPQLPAGTGVHAIPASLLKAVGWVESGWRQFDAAGRPLVAPDFGYGIMQITSGMAGAFGDVHGDLSPDVQSKIAGDFVYNIAYGARMLAEKWSTTPTIGDGDPAVIENWYYALWAYNGWGWVNNPNNPRFSRSGTPASNPAGFPYEERVLYLVAHPPRDAAGNPMWQPVPVTLPSRSTIAATPRSFTPAAEHRQDVAALSAVYSSRQRVTAAPGTTLTVPVRIENTGTLPWPSTGTASITLTYHLLTSDGDPFGSLSPFASGVLAFGQGQVPLPADMLSGRLVSLSMRVKAPATPGTYQVVWDLQQGAQTWFSQQGVLPRTMLLTVSLTPSTPVFTPTPGPLRTVDVEDERYVRDTSIPDGSLLEAGQPFDKGWLIFNPGKTAWSAGWTLRHVSGSSFGLKSAPLPPAPACSSVDLVVSMKAPRRPGSYKGTWRVYDPGGLPIGDRLTVVVQVAGSNSHATPTPTPLVTRTPTGAPKPSPTTTPTPLG